jgi:hypothetical protein
MKKFLIFLLIFLLVVGLAIVGLTVYVLTNSKSLLLSQIEKGLGVKAEASSVRIAFPDSLIVEDLTLGDKITCRRLTVAPSLIGFLSGEVVVRAIVAEKPVVRVTRNADDTIDVGVSLPREEVGREASPDPGEIPVSKEARGFEPRRFVIENISIVDGRVEFTDMATGTSQPFTGILEDLQVHAGQVSFLQPDRIRYDAQGRLSDAGGNTSARLKSTGWINPFLKDMDAELHLSDVDLTAFKSYYLKFMKKELATGLMLLRARLTSEKNDLTVNGHIELGNISFAKAGASEVSVEDIGMLAFERVLAIDGKVSFDFTIRTKLDQPRLEGLKLKGNFFQKKVENLLSKPPEETVRDFKEIGKQFEEIGKQLKEAFKAAPEGAQS